MKLLIAFAALAVVSACTQQEPSAQTPAAANAGTINQDGMPATSSGTSQSAPAAPVNNDPQSASNDNSTATASTKNKQVKQGSSDATKAKLDSTRPGTEHDVTGGNDSGAGSGSGSGSTAK